MSVVYAVAVKTARMTTTRDRFVDGVLEIGTANMATVLATFTLSATAGSVSGVNWTLEFVANTVAAAASGTAAAARIKRSVANGGAAEITGLTVGTASADIIVNNVTVVSGQDVTLNSAVITHAV